MQLPRCQTWMLPMHALLWLGLCVQARAQGSEDSGNEAGFVPIISGGAGYVHHVSGGVTALEPQVSPVLLVPFGRRFLLESRTDFFGFFQRENRTSGPFKGKVFTTVEYSQLDWLASTHLIAVGGRYLLPFGLYNERLAPVWIHNLQDAPLSASIGTRTTGAGVGPLLRGVAVQTASMSVQYSAYFSAHSGVEQFDSARTAGGDASIFFPSLRFEIGGSAQRFLESRHINASAAYVSWQPLDASLDTKAEYDYSYYGQGYWLESAYKLDHLSVPSLIRKAQFVGRVEQAFPRNGGGNGLPHVRTTRFDVGLNYYLRDNLRLVSSYGRSFTDPQKLNIWNGGITYRFTIPLWFGGKK